MGLKAVVTTLDDIPEALHELYVEQDGRYVLTVDGVDDHPAVGTLKNAYERTKAERKQYIEDLKALRAKVDGLPDDFDPDEFDRLKAELEELKAGEPDKGAKKPDGDAQSVRKMLEQRIASLEKKHASEVDAMRAEVEAKAAVINRLIVDDGLTRALMEAGVTTPSFVRAAKAMLAPSVKIDDDEGDYKAIVETDMGPVPLDKFVADWAASDEGRVFVAPARGADATGNGRMKGGQPNPWAKGSVNLTEQGRILRDDPEKARRMAKAAGVTL